MVDSKMASMATMLCFAMAPSLKTFKAPNYTAVQSLILSLKVNDFFAYHLDCVEFECIKICRFDELTSLINLVLSSMFQWKS